MSLTKQQALEMFRSDDLIGIGMEADALRSSFSTLASTPPPAKILIAVG